MDLGPKIIASTRRAQSTGLFREALRRFVWKRQGGGVAPTTPAKLAKHRLRRGLTHEQRCVRLAKG